MKTLLILSFLLLVTAGFSQDTVQTTVQTKEEAKNALQKNKIKAEDSIFIFDRDEYTFTPNEFGYYISHVENGEEKMYGKLRRTTDDGFYIMTSKENGETSFGRFDDEGNFRALRYDIQSDSIVEENFEILNPVERRDKNRRSGDSIQQKN